MGFFVRFWTREISAAGLSGILIKIRIIINVIIQLKVKNSSCILDSDGLLFGLNTLDLGLWKRRILTTWSPDAWKSFNFNSRKGLWKCWKFN
ncbi:uncharacterized protein OCT59_001434 [Rhizophagus irregularis]|uniref:uncharacterized protein n=1 Tax=Rhizophagus irregularis TaxID=588596 RepID=UPI0019DCDEC0|nr:hypothetical protein OCT59_001434 [Rhizophagus irregularis]GBC50648.2 hypothetical protein RIR_jg11721.t1 [Rhizophagus irregularis DAOM 181602=DAOM 197198]